VAGALVEPPVTASLDTHLHLTGASSGIGAATAVRLARGGLTVAGLARRADRLTDVAATIADNAGTAVAYAVDLTDAAARERVITRSGRSSADRAASCAYPARCDSWPASNNGWAGCSTGHHLIPICAPN
jgi:NAD(P)-dependent dehydrogenase (short-subunit alcohol dehydrogenase family)